MSAFLAGIYFFVENTMKQDCIPVGCRLPAHWPACSALGGRGVCSRRDVPGPGGVSALGDVCSCGGGVFAPRGCTWSWGGGGCLLCGVYLVWGCTWSGTSPPVDRQTPVNILPCPKLRLRAVIKEKLVRTVFAYYRHSHDMHGFDTDPSAKTFEYKLRCMVCIRTNGFFIWRHQISCHNLINNNPRIFW